MFPSADQSTLDLFSLLILRAPVSGSKHRSPAMANATAISGEAMNACVFGLPSARLSKARLNEVTIDSRRSEYVSHTLPLSDTRSAGIGHHRQRRCSSKVVNHAVSAASRPHVRCSEPGLTIKASGHVSNVSPLPDGPPIAARLKS